MREGHILWNLSEFTLLSPPLWLTFTIFNFKNISNFLYVIFLISLPVHNFHQLKFWFKFLSPWHSSLWDSPTIYEDLKCTQQAKDLILFLKVSTLLCSHRTQMFILEIPLTFNPSSRSTQSIASSHSFSPIIILLVSSFIVHWDRQYLHFKLFPPSILVIKQSLCSHPYIPFTSIHFQYQWVKIYFYPMACKRNIQKLTKITHLSMTQNRAVFICFFIISPINSKLSSFFGVSSDAIILLV